MKKGIHPTQQECVITCACGNTFTTMSNKSSHFVEVCSSCSPAYTGKKVKTQKAGKVDQFIKKYNWRSKQIVFLFYQKI